MMIASRYCWAEDRLGVTLAVAIRDYFDRCPDITTAYLFGSYARGGNRQGSDIDIAILFAGVGDKLERFEHRF